VTALLVLVATLLALYVVAAHNRFVRQQELVEESWQQLQVELRRRQDLVPALVETVQAYVRDAHRDDEALAAVRAAEREARAAATPPEVGAAEGRLTTSLPPALSRLPPGPYEQLQARLSETEDRIAAARRFYNGNVRALEVRRATYPSALVARLTGVTVPEPLDDGPAAPLLDL
jgi:LemA protein